MAEQKWSIWSRLYHGETTVDFVGRWKLWFAVSGAVIVVGIVSLVTQGLHLGIDFEGGVVWEVPVDDDVSVADARDVVEPLGLGDAKIQTSSSEQGQRIRVQAEPLGQEEEQEVTAALAQLGGVEGNDVSLNSVGPSWGDEITNKARRALIFFLVAITIYITLRFEWKMAVATLAALFHDILVTVGVYSLFQFEVTPATVIAILTILGYSIYDGIVVFDKVEENTRGLAASGRLTYGQTVNVSLNQVLMRTLNTSITALLPISSLLIVGSVLLGAETLQEFALALLIGLGASAYSSIFIASPLLAILKEREPRYAAIRQRLSARSSAPPLTPAAAAAPAASAAAPASVGRAGDSGGRTGEERPATRSPTSGRPIQPRPRKKGKRR